MAAPHRVILVGTGNRGEAWCRSILPPNVADGLVEVVAAADVNPDALENAREAFGLGDERCHTDASAAFAAHDADAAVVVVPPEHREAIVDAALDHDLHVLSEKPLADSLSAAARIVGKVEREGKKMGVAMNHRFRDDVTSLRRRVESGDYGAVDRLALRFAVSARSRGRTYPDRYYEVDDPLFLPQAVHHLDLLDAMVDAPPETVYARSWNPPWSDFSGPPQAEVVLGFADGTTATYGAANANAATLNGWNSERIRAECADATLVLDDRELRCHEYRPEAESVVGAAGPTGERVLPLDEQAKWGSAWLVEQFAEWVEGGDPMATNARANLRSMALVTAAAESAETGAVVDVRERLTTAEATADEVRDGSGPAT